MLVANDGFSAGHIARTIAIARGLVRRSARRGIESRLVLATTSEAHALLAAEPLAIVRLPPPLAARRAGFSDLERRRLVRGALEGVVEAFAPDLIACDTFPSGPHGELAGIGVGRARRALIRRTIPADRAHDEALARGLADYDLAIVADDPIALPAELAIPMLRVPPITIAEGGDGLSREAARAALALPATGRCVLIAAGGGGDREAGDRAREIAEAIARLAPGTTVVLAPGPLAPDPVRASPEIRIARAAPLQPLLAAFDAAFAPAGYNTAHELAKAGIPAALFALPRPFDDQAGRAARFARAGLGYELRRFDDEAIAAAIAWTASPRAPAPGPGIEACGADRAADALLDLVTR
jgi:UDP-N-acetylglucosamine--N-acetylmuramyl-(pentapeptide) pyrophosphoryl-undecaprenol N-acetylglucosamine transferase